MVDLYGTPSEANLLAHLVKRYEQVMRRTYANLATEPHRLYLRLRTPGPCLSPTVHQLCTPVRFVLAGEELRSRVSRTLLSVLAHEREVQARQLAARLWTHQAKLATLNDEITFTIAHTKGLIWSHPGLVDSTVTKANQVAAAMEEQPKLEAAVAEVAATLERWRPLVDGLMRVHGVLEDLGRIAGSRTPALPESVLMTMFRSALRRGVTEVAGATGLVHELQGPTAPPELTVEEARSKGAKALVSALLSRAPSRMVSRAASRMVSRAASMAPSRMESNMTTADAIAAAQQLAAEVAADAAAVAASGSPDRDGMLDRFDSFSSSIAALPPGIDKGHVGPSGRPESASSVWTTWTADGQPAGPSAIAAAVTAAAQLLDMSPPPPPTCTVEELAEAVLRNLWTLAGAALGPAEARTFRLLLSLHEQLVSGELSKPDAQICFYVLGRGTPSAQAAAVPRAAGAEPAGQAAIGGMGPLSVPQSPHFGPSPPSGGTTPGLTSPHDALPHPLNATSSTGQDTSASTVAGESSADTAVTARPMEDSSGAASRPTTAKGAFCDPSIQAAVKEVLIHTPRSSHTPPASMVQGPAQGAATTSGWPSESAMADLRWLESCGCDEDLAGLAAAVSAAPRVWHAALAAEAVPPAGRADVRSRYLAVVGELPARWRQLLLDKPAFKVG